jgi:hypothetical protein
MYLPLFTARSVSALIRVKTRRDAAGEQRPVEAERQRQIAAIDHLVGLLGGARSANPDESQLRRAPSAPAGLQLRKHGFDRRRGPNLFARLFLRLN